MVEACDRFDGRGRALSFLSFYIKRGLGYYRKSGLARMKIWSRYTSVDTVGVLDDDNGDTGCGGWSSCLEPVSIDRHEEHLHLQERVLLIKQNIRNTPCRDSSKVVSLLTAMASECEYPNPPSIGEISTRFGLSRQRGYQILDQYIRPATRMALAA